MSHGSFRSNLKTGVCVTPAIAINIFYQMSHGGSGPWPYVFSMVSALSVIGACLCVKAMRKSLKDMDFLALVLAFLVFTPCSAFNLLNAVGAAGFTRSEVTGVRRSLTTGVNSLQDAIKGLKEQLKTPVETAMGKTPSMAQSDLDEMQQDARWKSSEGCTDATVTQSREFCKSYRRKEGVLAAAREVERLNKELHPLEADLRKQEKNPAVGGPEDPQTNSIANAAALAGVSADEKTIGSLLGLLLAIVAEFVGSLLPAVIDTLDSSEPAPAKTPSLPEALKIAPTVSAQPMIVSPTGVSKGRGTKVPCTAVKKTKQLAEPPWKMLREFCAERVMEKPGRIQAKDLHECHKAWCETKGYKPMNITVFGLGMKALEYEKEEIGGRTYYLNVALKGPALKLVQPKAQTRLGNFAKVAVEKQSA